MADTQKSVRISALLGEESRNAESSQLTEAIQRKAKAHKQQKKPKT